MLTQTSVPQLSCIVLQLEVRPLLPRLPQSTPETAEWNPSISPEYVAADVLELLPLQHFSPSSFVTGKKESINRMEASCEMANGLG